MNPNADPRIAYETVETCLCRRELDPAPIWGWGVCAGCSTWVNTKRPTPDSLAYVYDETYWSATQELAGNPSLEQRFRRDMKDRVPQYLEVLEAHLSPASRIAEIGCGNARLLHELAAKGHDCVGTELDEGVIDRVRALTDVPILQGGIERIEPGSCDAIVCVDVLEHVHEPVRFLAELRSRLREGGLMLLHTPVIDDPARPYRYSVAMMWKLYHLYLFGRPLLERLIREAELEVVDEGTEVFGWTVYVLRRA